jgi:hypothetical protein
MTTEQLEGYFKRLGLTYRVGADDGDDGLIHVAFKTRWYRCALPPRTKHLGLIVMLTNGGSLLTVAAPYVYHMRQAKKAAAFHEHLMALNFQSRYAQFQLDRRDGEVRCCAHVPVVGSNFSIEAFRRLVFSIPSLVDVNHRQAVSVLRTGKLPPAPKPPEFFTRLLEELTHRAGSVENLRKIVEEHEASATKSVRKRKEEICNHLPDEGGANDVGMPAVGAPHERPPVAPVADESPTSAPPQGKASAGDSAADAAPPTVDSGPDQPQP